MHMPSSPRTILPHAAPAGPYRRLLLFGIRRTAVGGIDDAHAAHAFLTGFGLNYRRPLVLLRAFMAELSRVSAVRLTVAHCCCPRMTPDEAMLLGAVADAPLHAREVHARMTARLQVSDCLGLLTSAQALAASFDDLGMPLHDCI